MANDPPDGLEKTLRFIKSVSLVLLTALGLGVCIWKGLGALGMPQEGCYGVAGVVAVVLVLGVMFSHMHDEMQ